MLKLIAERKRQEGEVFNINKFAVSRQDTTYRRHFNLVDTDFDEAVMNEKSNTRNELIEKLNTSLMNGYSYRRPGLKMKSSRSKVPTIAFENLSTHHTEHPQGSDRARVKSLYWKLEPELLQTEPGFIEDIEEEPSHNGCNFGKIFSIFWD